MNAIMMYRKLQHYFFVVGCIIDHPSSSLPNLCIFNLPLVISEAHTLLEASSGGTGWMELFNVFEGRYLVVKWWDCLNSMCWWGRYVVEGLGLHCTLFLADFMTKPEWD